MKTGILELKRDIVAYTISPHHIAAAVILLGLAIRTTALLIYGNAFSTSSDDENYIFGTINTMMTGQLTYGFAWPSEPSMIIMPTLQVFLGLIFRIFGYTQSDIVLVRFFINVIGCLGIIGLYKLGERLFNPTVALIATAMWALWPPNILSDNLILTETPFIACILWFSYYVVKYCDTKKDSDFLTIILFWYVGFMTRSVMALIPFMFVLYFLAKKFPIKLLLKRGIFAVVILGFLCFPWWLRNYQITGDFVSSTGSSGTVLLLGTFFGNYPETEFGNQHEEALTVPGEINSLYNRMQRQGDYARYRLSYWWQTDRQSLMEAYLIIKPRHIFTAPYYMWEIFEIPRQLVRSAFRAILFLSFLGALVGVAIKQVRASIIVCVMMVGYGLLLAVVFLPYPRYMYPFMPFVFLLAAYALGLAGTVLARCVPFICKQINLTKLRGFLGGSSNSHLN